MFRALLGLVALAVALDANAAVYRCVQNGQTVFSDVECPGAGRKLVSLPPANTVRGATLPTPGEDRARKYCADNPGIAASNALMEACIKQEIEAGGRLSESSNFGDASASSTYKARKYCADNPGIAASNALMESCMKQEIQAGTRLDGGGNFGAASASSIYKARKYCSDNPGIAASSALMESCMKQEIQAGQRLGR